MQMKSVMLILGLWVALMVGIMVSPSQRRQPQQVTPMEAPVPLQEWTTADAGRWVASLVPGKLPAPDPRQLRDGCKESLGQHMLKGACWQLLAVPPPCPLSDGAFEHDDGRCYVRVLKAAAIPTSGDIRPHGVAEP